MRKSYAALIMLLIPFISLADIEDEPELSNVPNAVTTNVSQVAVFDASPDGNARAPVKYITMAQLEEIVAEYTSTPFFVMKSIADNNINNIGDGTIGDTASQPIRWKAGSEIEGGPSNIVDFNAAVNNVVTIQQTAFYHVIVTVDHTIVTGSRHTIGIQYKINGGALSSEIGMSSYARNSGGQTESESILNCMIQLNAGDTLEITVKRLGAPGTAALDDEGATLQIYRISK